MLVKGENFGRPDRGGKREMMSSVANNVRSQKSRDVSEEVALTRGTPISEHIAEVYRGPLATPHRRFCTPHQGQLPYAIRYGDSKVNAGRLAGAFTHAVWRIATRFRHEGSVRWKVVMPVVPENSPPLGIASMRASCKRFPCLDDPKLQPFST
jgi:hypothetical protein